MRSTASSNGPGIGSSPSAANNRSDFGMRVSVAASLAARSVLLKKPWAVRMRLLVRLAGDEDRPAEQLALEAQVVVAVAFVPLADLACIGVARIRSEPLLERAPVQRLVAVPVIVARCDDSLQREPRRLDRADGLAQRDEALVVDAARQRPL